MTWESDGVVSVTLRAAGGGELPRWEVGAHIDLVMRLDLIRQYSLCGDPANASEWRIAVLREDPGTGGSRHVHETLRPGQVIAAAGPRNNFPLVDAPSYVFVAGGIGVTPFLPMVAAVAGRDAQWHLLYGGRTRRSMAFLPELSAYGSNVTIAPEDESGLLDLKRYIGEAEADAAIYCCGPEPLIAAVEEVCRDLGRAEPLIERFHARPGAAATVDSSADTAFDVILAGTGSRFTIEPGMTIADALDDAGVFAPTSCREGYCGICETAVLAGIPDHRDDYLTPEDREANKTMMICISRSKTAEIEIQL
jgi:ferredoxin-NADP reductase